MNISAIGSQYGGMNPTMFMNGASRMGGAGMDKSQFAGNMIADLDADGDGALSTDEVSGLGRLEDAFGDIDTDGDGLLTQAELEAGRPEGPPRMGGFGARGDMGSMLLEAMNQNFGQAAYSENSLFASLFGGDDSSSSLVSLLNASV